MVLKLISTINLPLVLKALRVLAVPADIKLNRASYFTSRVRDMHWLEVEFSFTLPHQAHLGTGRLTDVVSVGIACITNSFPIYQMKKVGGNHSY